MRVTRYVLGALAVVTALALARDMAGNIAIAGTPTPLSIESMRSLTESGCPRPPGLRVNALQRLENSVFEVGVTDSRLVVCTVYSAGKGVSTLEIGPPGDQYFTAHTSLFASDGVVEIGRVAPEVAVLEFVLPDGQVVEAELSGEIYLCRVPKRITNVRIRAYDARGRLLREAEI